MGSGVRLAREPRAHRESGNYRRRGVYALRGSVEDRLASNASALQPAEEQRALVMRQQNLFEKPKCSPRSRADDYDAVNLRNARLILEDIERWGGEPALPVVWARMVVARLEPGTI